MRTSRLAILLLFLGCSSDEQSRSVPLRPSTEDPRSGPSAEPSLPTESEPGIEAPRPAAGVYARSPEVQRLLYRARQLRAEGQFEQSLAVIEQALQRDPYDPEAAALRQELLEILRRA